MKAIWINSTERTITEVDYAGYKDLQRMVGGSISAATRWNNGDALYVDDEGMFKAQAAFFRITGVEQLLAGNGVIVGREIGDTADTRPPTATVATVQAHVTFYDRAHADAWGKANASEPSATFATFEKDGTLRMATLGTMGELFGQMPRPPSEEEPKEPKA